MDFILRQMKEIAPVINIKKKLLKNWQKLLTGGAAIFQFVNGSCYAPVRVDVTISPTSHSVIIKLDANQNET